MELRCQDNTLHGRLVDGRLEVKCRDRKCDYKPGITILHYFDLETGKLVDTKKFADPNNKFNANKKEEAACR